jgi:hypothetical protein
MFARKGDQPIAARHYEKHSLPERFRDAISEYQAKPKAKLH